MNLTDENSMTERRPCLRHPRVGPSAWALKKVLPRQTRASTQEMDMALGVEVAGAMPNEMDTMKSDVQHGSVGSEPCLPGHHQLSILTGGITSPITIDIVTELTGTGTEIGADAGVLRGLGTTLTHTSRPIMAGMMAHGEMTGEDGMIEMIGGMNGIGVTEWTMRTVQDRAAREVVAGLRSGTGTGTITGGNLFSMKFH